MATSVTYNGIALGNVLTREFDQTIVRDESGTDKLYSHFRVTVETVANAGVLAAAVQNLGLVGTGVNGTIPGRVVETARHLLGEDRGEFIYYQDGQEILKSNALLDANNGPKVSGLKVTHTSQATIKIQFTIELSLVDCQLNNPGFDVINNRWSSTDDYDELFRCTRTWRGKLRLGSARFSPHQFRGLVVPPLQAGWRRSHMSFVGETNALELGYEITDQQLMGDAAPWPAAKMHIAHTEGFSLTGAKGFTNFSMHLEGAPGTSRATMISWGLAVMATKLSVKAGNDNIRQFIRQIAVTENNGDSSNSVEITAQLERLTVSPSTGVLTGIQAAFGAAGFERLGGSLRDLNIAGYDPTIAINLGAYPDGNEALAGLYAAYLQTPCESQHGIATGAVAGSPQGQDYPLTTGSYTPDNSKYQSAPIPDSMTSIGYSQAQQDGMYVHAKINSSYDIDDGRVFLPIAKGGGRFGDGADSLIPIRLNPRTARRVVFVEYERIGVPPDLWKLDDFTDANGIVNYFDGCKPEFQPPQTLGDGSTLYVVDATYEFALSRAPNDGERYQACSLPWDTTVAASNGYAAGTFIPGSDAKGL